MHLTLRDVANILNVSENTVYRWISDKQLPARQVDGLYCFSSMQLFEWATLHHIDVPPKAFAQFTPENSEQVRFDSALRCCGILPDVRGENANEVVCLIVNALPLPDSFDRENLIALILAGNGLRATSIGDGIALPHPRRPIVIPGRPPAVTLCYLANPLPNESGDKEPIQTLFLKQSPTVRVHLQLLARLAYASRDEKFRQLLRRRAPAADVLNEAHHVEEAFRTMNGNGQS